MRKLGGRQRDNCAPPCPPEPVKFKRLARSTFDPPADAGSEGRRGYRLGRKRPGGGAANRRYRVGEMGSEWFVPNTDAVIIPNMDRTAQTGELRDSSGVNVGGTVINIAGKADAQAIAALRQEIAAHRHALPAAIDARVQDRIKRGGLLMSAGDCHRRDRNLAS